jgi:hypothetical protein
MAISFETTLDDSKFQAGLKNMEKGGKKVEGSLVGSFSSMAKGIGASMAAAFTIQAVVGAAKAVLDFVGQLQDQAEALGVSTQILQGFQGAMANSGVSADKFTKGMATLISSIQQAKEDTGTARDSFAALGIEFDSIARDSPDQILLKIADGLANATDPATAYAAALDLVGKNQINFVAALKGGSEEFQDSAAKIKKLSDGQVAAIAAVGDAWDQAMLAVKGYAAEALLALVDPVGSADRRDVADQIQNVQDQKKVAAGDMRKIEQMEKFLKAADEQGAPAHAQKKVMEDMGIQTMDRDKFKNELDSLKKTAEHTARQKAKYGTDYSQETPVERADDPRKKKEMSDLAAAQAKIAMDNLTNDRVNAEKVADHQADLDAERTEKEQADLKEFYAQEEKYEMEKQLDIARYEQEKLDDLKKFYEEDAAYELEKQLDIADFQKKQQDEKKKDAIREKMEKADQDLQQAQKVTAKAEKETVDARDSLKRALEGNPDARETGMQKQVKRRMDKLEKQLDDPEPGKKRTELGSSLDDAAKSTSSRRGTKKALEELKTAKDAEKAAKDAEDLIKEQQKKMVKALEDIDKGINGG